MRNHIRAMACGYYDGLMTQFVTFESIAAAMQWHGSAGSEHGLLCKVVPQDHTDQTALETLAVQAIVGMAAWIPMPPDEFTELFHTYMSGATGETVPVVPYIVQGAMASHMLADTLHYAGDSTAEQRAAHNAKIEAQALIALVEQDTVWHSTLSTSWHADCMQRFVSRST